MVSRTMSTSASGTTVGVAAANEQRRRGDTVEGRRLRHLAVGGDDRGAGEASAPAAVVAEVHVLRQLLRHEGAVRGRVVCETRRDRLVNRCEGLIVPCPLRPPERDLRRDPDGGIELHEAAYALGMACGEREYEAPDEAVPVDDVSLL